MKHLLLIILLLYSFKGFAQGIKYDLQGNWLAINTIGYRTNFVPDMNGNLLGFNHDSISFGHIFYNSKNSFSYIVLDSAIVIKDSIRIIINQIDADSIKLIFDNERLVTFLKLPFTKQHLFKIDLITLTDNSWTYSDSNYIQRIEFQDKEWEYNDDDAFECYTHLILDSSFYDPFSNKWRIFDLGGSTYFARTFGQIYGVLH